MPRPYHIAVQSSQQRLAVYPRHYLAVNILLKNSLKQMIVNCCCGAGLVVDGEHTSKKRNRRVLDFWSIDEILGCSDEAIVGGNVIVAELLGAKASCHSAAAIAQHYAVVAPAIAIDQSPKHALVCVDACKQDGLLAALLKVSR